MHFDRTVLIFVDFVSLFVLRLEHILGNTREKKLPNNSNNNFGDFFSDLNYSLFLTQHNTTQHTLYVYFFFISSRIGAKSAILFYYFGC